MSYNSYGNTFMRNTPVVMNLIIINALAFLAQYFIGGSEFPNQIDDLFALHYYKSDYFHIHQFITHMFMHGGFGHLFFNMLAMWMFGTLLERIWGPKKFLIFYFVCGLAAAAAQMLIFRIKLSGLDPYLQNEATAAIIQENLRRGTVVGASGAIMGLIGGAAYLFPNTQVIIFPFPIPMKLKWMACILALIDLFGGLNRIPGDDVAHFAHLGGLAAGVALVWIWNRTNKKTFY